MSSHQDSYSSSYTAQCRRTSTPCDNKFCKWMDIIEKKVFSKTGHRLLDLPDEMYMPNFENGLSADEMARQVTESFWREYGWI